MERASAELILPKADAAWDDKPLAQSEDDALHLELDGWEGPLDVLLDLARRQKVDLRTISILDLVDQYLGFIEQSRTLRLELAADYLVMAAWLAYLKSLLLLPRDPEQQPTSEDLALKLQLRLQRLGAMREAGVRLMARDRLGRDVFARAHPEGLRTDRHTTWRCDLFMLIDAYGQTKARTAPMVHMVRERPVMTLESAIARITALLGAAAEWTELASFLPARSGQQSLDPRLARSALASSFAATLELAKQRRLEMSQEAVFGPLMLRKSR